MTRKVRFISGDNIPFKKVIVKDIVDFLNEKELPVYKEFVEGFLVSYCGYHRIKNRTGIELWFFYRLVYDPDTFVVFSYCDSPFASMADQKHRENMERTIKTLFKTPNNLFAMSVLIHPNAEPDVIRTVPEYILLENQLDN